MAIESDEIEDRKAQRMQDFFSRFGIEHPYAMVLLQGHLLVEELLEEIVLSVCANQDVVRDARFSFYVKLRLSEGIHGGALRLWPQLDKLNSARNELAHGRDLGHLEKKIDAFIESVPNPLTPEGSDSPEGDRLIKLKLAIVIVSGYLARLAESFRRSTEEDRGV